MFDRFTDRARKVMALANQEAQRFNHEYIGTEHILLGIVKEGSGVAIAVMKNMGIDPRKVRLEVEKIVKSAPDVVTMGKLPQTPRAKRVIELAIDNAKAIGDNYVGTQHLLLGLIDERDGVAGTVLIALGMTLENTREEIKAILPADAPAQPMARQPNHGWIIVNSEIDMEAAVIAVLVALDDAARARVLTLANDRWPLTRSRP